MATACAFTRPRAETAAEHRSQSWAGAVLVVVACLGVEAVVGVVTSAGLRGDWYANLSKPTWTPPAHLFGPAATALHLMLAAAGALVWLNRDREDVCCPLAGFGLLLAAGLAWAVLFFGVHAPFLAFLDVLLVWVLAGVTMLHFFEVSRAAGWLAVPVFLAASVLVALNGAVLALAG